MMYSHRAQRIFSFLLAILFVSSFLVLDRASAQYSSTWIGVRAGASIASEAIDVPENTSSSFRIGPIGGITFDHFFNENFGLSASLLYDAKGVNLNYGSAAGRTDSATGKILFAGDDNYSFSYLEIPIVAKLSFGYGDIKPYVFAGPSIGILLAAKEETAPGTAGTEAVPPVTDLKSNLNTVDVSAYFGAGIMDRIYQGPTLFLDLGYAVGLTSIYKTTPENRRAGQHNPFSQPIDPATAKSGDIRVTIGAMWKIGQ
jgi:hypothetical protein